MQKKKREEEGESREERGRERGGFMGCRTGWGERAFQRGRQWFRGEKKRKKKGSKSKRVSIKVKDVQEEEKKEMEV